MLVGALAACSTPQTDAPNNESVVEYPTIYSTEIQAEEYPQYPEYREYPQYPEYPEYVECPEYVNYQEEYSEIVINIPYVETLPGDIAVQYIMFMNDNLYARTAFTYRELETAEWLVETLIGKGFDSEDIVVQEFTLQDAFSTLSIAGTHDLPTADDFMLNILVHAGEREVRRYSQNVILTIPGESNKTIIVGAHYDTWAFPGANDNASGVALLLESAYRMRDLDNYYTLIYVFFGAEEVGVLGSSYFLSTLSRAEIYNILFMLNADLLFEGSYLLFTPGVMVTGVQWGGLVGSNRITRAFENIALELNDLHDDLELFSYPEGLYRFFSDHRPFYMRGIPVIMFSGMYRDDELGFSRRPFMFYLGYGEDGRPRAIWTDTYRDGVFISHAGILHSWRDDISFINEHWPGKIERAMWGYGIFLEAILLQRYT